MLHLFKQAFYLKADKSPVIRLSQHCSKINKVAQPILGSVKTDC